VIAYMRFLRMIVVKKLAQASPDSRRKRCERL
jgi:hypothetical protein